MSTVTPIRQSQGFGPGLYESLTLTSWVDRHRNRWVRLVGTTPIYCGATGVQHDVDIDERDHLSEVERDLANQGVHYPEPDHVADWLYAQAMESDQLCDCERY